MTDNRCDPEARFSKEDNHSLEVLGNWITQKKREESGRMRKATNQELVARNNAKPKIMTARNSNRATVPVVVKEQMARDVISPAGRRVGREMVTITRRTSVPRSEFISVGCWGF